MRWKRLPLLLSYLLVLAGSPVGDVGLLRLHLLAQHGADANRSVSRNFTAGSSDPPADAVVLSHPAATEPAANAPPFHSHPPETGVSSDEDGSGVHSHPHPHPHHNAAHAHEPDVAGPLRGSEAEPRFGVQANAPAGLPHAHDGYVHTHGDPEEERVLQAAMSGEWHLSPHPPILAPPSAVRPLLLDVPTAVRTRTAPVETPPPRSA